MKTTLFSTGPQALLFASLGLSIVACAPQMKQPYLQVNSYEGPSSGWYASVPSGPKNLEKPYVLLAQNETYQSEAYNALRGMQSNPSFAPAYFGSYTPENAPYDGIYQNPQSRQVPANSIQLGLKHQLDEQVQFRQNVHTTEPDGPRFNDGDRIAHDNFAVVPRETFSAGYLPDNYPDDQNYTFETQAGPLGSNRTSLYQSLNSARRQSPRLAIEDIRIQEAEEGLVQAKAQGRFRLNLDSTIGASQNETDFSVINRTDSAFRLPRAASLDLSLPLYQGGRINAQKKVAKVGIDAARADYGAVETAVTQDAAIAHVNVLRDRKLIQIYTRNVRLLEEQTKVTRAMVRAGESTLTDEALLDARLASLIVQLRQAEADLAASESNYRNLTGHEAPDLLPVGEIALPSSLVEIKDAVLQNNPRLKAGQTRAKAAEHNIQLAKSFGRPRLALQGVLRAAEGQSDTIRRNSAAEVLLNLSMPLLSGGENKSRVRQAVLAQSRAVLETRALHDNLNERIEQLWAQIQSAKLSITPNLAQKAAGLKAYDAINKQRQAGVATLLDVLSVEQTLLDAELNLVRTENIEKTARLELLGLMGAF